MHAEHIIPRPHGNEEHVFPSSSHTRPVLPHVVFFGTKLGLMHHLVAQGLLDCAAVLGSLHFSTLAMPESDERQGGSAVDSPGEDPAQALQPLHWLTVESPAKHSPPVRNVQPEGQELEGGGGGGEVFGGVRGGGAVAAEGGAVAGGGGGGDAVCRDEAAGPALHSQKALYILQRGLVAAVQCADQA